MEQSLCPLTGWSWLGAGVSFTGSDPALSKQGNSYAQVVVEFKLARQWQPFARDRSQSGQARNRRRAGQPVVPGTCCAPAYTDAALASRLPDATFALYFGAKNKVAEQRIEVAANRTRSKVSRS